MPLSIFIELSVVPLVAVSSIVHPARLVPGEGHPGQASVLQISINSASGPSEQSDPTPSKVLAM